MVFKYPVGIGVFFCPVHGVVGTFQQSRLIRAVVRVKADPNRSCDPGSGPTFKAGDDPFGNGASFLFILDGLDQNRELIAAQAGDGI